MQLLQVSSIQQHVYIRSYTSCIIRLKGFKVPWKPELEPKRNGMCIRVALKIWTYNVIKMMGLGKGDSTCKELSYKVDMLALRSHWVMAHTHVGPFTVLEPCLRVLYEWVVNGE